MLLGRSAIRAISGKVVVFDTSRGERYLGWIVAVSRAIPVLSFDIISYAAGISGLSAGIYAVATLLGMIPSTFLLTYVGSAFMVSPWLALGLSGLVAVLLAASPWLIERYNPFGLCDLVRIE
jgi:uncharacterized membrane protein YdjX (TVP38/TMEM64 family)